MASSRHPSILWTLLTRAPKFCSMYETGLCYPCRYIFTTVTIRQDILVSWLCGPVRAELQLTVNKVREAYLCLRKILRWLEPGKKLASGVQENAIRTVNGAKGCGAQGDGLIMCIHKSQGQWLLHALLQLIFLTPLGGRSYSSSPFYRCRTWWLESLSIGPKVMEPVSCLPSLWLLTTCPH